MYNRTQSLTIYLFCFFNHRNIYNDDRRFRHYCPLTNVATLINADIQDQTLLNLPCNKTNEKFILFAHLQ